MEKSELQFAAASESHYGRCNPNSILGGTFSILALGFLFYVIPAFIEIPAYMQHPLLSPRFLPQLAGWLVLALSLLLMIDGLIKPPKRSETDEFRRGVPIMRQVLMVAAGIVYVLFFEELGAIGSGVLASVLLFLASGLRTIWVYALAIIFPAVVTLLFIYVLNVPLPPGTLWESLSLI
ncbi:tripartite tricarboxylate transporter TctB family protein [Marinobacter sp. F3R08]|uniref:tripartite tricarboxylate transporter TctB family protein n=1 Tax=Marinobacter sp. F3R08 TaxID=2841559 RepID=UPI001C08A73E|nr:tripartite tricarboxylate transporter TctB family protein [Marinobacter sp. F3R08]MBU2954805.1 tripartite tricarboxylate transporter TctB family protein [Marinobacter sp. F3R08]